MDEDRTRAAATGSGVGSGTRGPVAFAELFAANEADVLRVCRRMLGDKSAADDARSEVFLRARRSFDTYDSERPFRPWLLAIAGNHCIDQLRQRATEQRVFRDAEPSDAELLRSPALEASTSPLRRLVLAQERGALSRAIESLPLKYRLPLMLRYFGDHDYAAIAEALGVTRNQVGTLLFRAKRRLRLELSGGPP